MRFHFTGSLTDGTTFASSAGRDTLSVTLGKGGISPDIETALSGMVPGDNASLDIIADNACGPHRPELIMKSSGTNSRPNSSADEASTWKQPSQTANPS